MSYNTVIYAEWKSAPLAETTFKIELKKKGFDGTARKVDATGRYIDHNYQSLNPKEPFKTMLLKSDLRFQWMVRSDADVLILEDIFNSDVGDYRIVKSVNENVEWTGNVAVDQLSYTRGPYPFSADIVSRDMDDLNGLDYGFFDGRDRIIKIIADILGSLGYDIPIRTYTRWKEGDMAVTDDFLNELYIDKSVLRVYGRGGEEDETITKYEALEMIARSFGLFFIQAQDYWNIYQLTALDSASSIREFEYDSDGTLLVVS